MNHLLRGIARAIAARIDGYEYVVPEDEGLWHNAYLRCADEPALKFHLRLDGSRLNVSLCYPQTAARRMVGPRDVYPNLENLDISVSVQREPEAIARDIKRRFIGKAEEQWARLKAAADEQDGYYRRKADLNRRIAIAADDGHALSRLLEREREGRLDENAVPVSLSIREKTPSFGWVDCRIDGEDSVKIEVSSASGEFAVKLIEFLNAVRLLEATEKKESEVA